MSSSPPDQSTAGGGLSRRAFVIAGSVAAALAWLARPEGARAAPPLAGQANTAIERPHRTLLGVL